MGAGRRAGEWGARAPGWAHLDAGAQVADLVGAARGDEHRLSLVLPEVPGLHAVLLLQGCAVPVIQVEHLRSKSSPPVRPAGMLTRCLHPSGCIHIALRNQARAMQQPVMRARPTYPAQHTPKP